MVPKQNAPHSFEELLLVDIDPSGALQTHQLRFANLSATQVSTLLTLRHRSEKRTPFTTRSQRRGNGDFGLARLMQDALSKITRDRCLVVLGSSFDPFSAAGSRFQLGVEVVKLIAKAQPAALCIQTSSPLVMLVTPILRSLGNRAAVTMAIQAGTSHTGLAKQNSVRPEDQLETTKTLRSVGIRTVLQLAPILEGESVKTYTRVVIESADFVTIAYAYANSRLCDQVRAELIRQAPHMLLEHIGQVWAEPVLESEAA